MQAALAPLGPAFGMDPVERALRTGGEASRDAAKKSEEDAGTLAGGECHQVACFCTTRSTQSALLAAHKRGVCGLRVAPLAVVPPRHCLAAVTV